MLTANPNDSSTGNNLPPEGYSRFSFCIRTNRSDSRKPQSITRVGLAEAKQDAHGWDYRKASLQYCTVGSEPCHVTLDQIERITEKVSAEM